PPVRSAGGEEPQVGQETSRSRARPPVGRRQFLHSITTIASTRPLWRSSPQVDGPDAGGGLGAAGSAGAAGRGNSGCKGEGVNALPSVDESCDRLHRAGWSLGEIATAGEWVVTGTNGDVGQPYCLLRQRYSGLHS